MKGNYHHLFKEDYEKYQGSGYYPWDKKKIPEKQIEITKTNKFMIKKSNDDVDETIKNDCLYSNEIKK